MPPASIRLVIILSCLFAVLLASCQRALMPTPNLIADEGAVAFESVPPALRTVSPQIVFVTDRVPEETQGPNGVRYSARRSPSLAFGLATVEFGNADTWDGLVRASTQRRRDQQISVRVSKIEEVDRAMPYPGIARVEGETIIERPEMKAEIARIVGGFNNLICSRLALTPRNEVFLFIHGFNNSLEDGVLTIAQLWHFMGRIGVPIAYSWPAGSGGMLRGYTQDRESSEFTVYHLKQTIRALAECPDVERIHIIAHSRGTDVAITSLRELVIEYRAAGRSVRNDLKIGHFMLAAPDLDSDVVAQRIGRERINIAPHTMTIYVSPHDQAIGLAEWLFRSENRIGRQSYESLSETSKQNLGVFGNLTVVQAMVRKSKADPHGHSYFYQHPGASSDVIRLLRDDRAPGAQHGRPLHQLGPGFWQLFPDYPETPDRAPSQTPAASPRAAVWYE